MKSLKPIFILVTIVIFVIILDFIAVNNTKNVVSIMNEKLENIDISISNKKLPIDEMNELIDEWEKREKLMSYYLEHDEIEKIGDKIYLLRKQIEIEDLDDARQSITEIKFLFEHIEEKQILNIENFF